MTSAQVVPKASSLYRAGQLAEQFEAAGFQVGPIVGNSFSIAGPVDLFERFFGVSATSDDRPFPGDQLPLTALDPKLRADIQTVLFSPPLAFGPGAQY
jgi:hypothetical protein